jgi:restriction endonuclease Mrr
VNQQRMPHGVSNSNVGCLLGFGVFGAIGIALCMLCSLPSALSSITTNPLSSFLIILVFLGSIAGGIWLLVFWLRFSTARAQKMVQEEAIRVQQQYDAYVAQQRYDAYVSQQQAIQAQRDREAYLARVGTLQGLLNLSPTEFELVIAELFTFWGYTDVEHTDGGGDLAADIICRDEAGSMTVVQCKRYGPGNLVGSPDVQKFIGMIVAHHHADRGVYVTTSSYTEPALALGREHDIRMIDGEELVAHMQEFRAAMEA